MNYDYRLPKKEKYTKKDLFELMVNTFYHPGTLYVWCAKAASSDEAAEQEFERCKEYYSRILKEMNENLPKAKPVLLGSGSSHMGAGFTVCYFYSHEAGYYNGTALNDGMSTD